MGIKKKKRYTNQTPTYYTLSLKLQIVSEIEEGKISICRAQQKYDIHSLPTVVNWLRKYGKSDSKNQTPLNLPKIQEQKLTDLEKEIRLLKKQKANRAII